MPANVASFNYSTEPKAVKPTKKYRNAEDDANLTMMSDPRVIRGNTHSMARKVAASNVVSAPPADARPREAAAPDGSFPTFNFCVPPFASTEMDLSRYLTEDTTTYVDTSAAATQSDAFLSRPETPEYLPRKTGIDCATQIDDPGALFDFNAEVRPMLDVIVEKTLEQAVFECEAEAELENLEAAAEEFRQRAAQELTWVKERQEAAAKEIKAKQGMISEKATERGERKELRTLVAGRKCMEQILPDVVDGACEDLYKSGMWTKPVETTIKDEVFPRLISNAVVQGEASDASQQMLDGELAAVCIIGLLSTLEYV